MVKNPVKKSGGKDGKDRIPHHLRPFRNLLVGSEDNGGVSIGITNESEEPVGLVTGL